MIRHPLRLAAARPTADLARVTDGISSSLRHFSAAQQRLAASDDKSQDGSNNRRPSKKERAATAISDLMAMGKSTSERISGGSGGSPSSSSSSAPAASSTSSTSSRPSTTLSGSSDFIKPKDMPQSKIIDVKSLPFRGGRGRGGGARGGARGGSGGFGSRGGGGGGGGARGGSARRGGGVRVRRRRDGEDSADDRPQREPAIVFEGSADEKSRWEDFVREAGGLTGEAVDARDEVENVDLKAYKLGVDQGFRAEYTPSLTLGELAGYGPAIAASPAQTKLGLGETAVLQARVLGGGEPYHHDYLPAPEDVVNRARGGRDVFFASGDEARAWLRTQSPTAKSKKVKIPWGPAPEETRRAILEAAMLGQYERPVKGLANVSGAGGPQSAGSSVRAYTNKDGTWGRGASQRLEDKIRSLLPQLQQQQGQQKGAAGAAPAKQGKVVKK